MRRDIVNFLFDNLAELQSYDMVKVYYDNGQRSIAESLHRAIEYALSKDAVVYRSAQPSEYRLSQAADYICTMELTAIKYAEHTATATDEKFFGKWSDFKKGILKETRKKTRLERRSALGGAFTDNGVCYAGVDKTPLSCIIGSS